ncbi:recombinase family protein [Rhizobium leguminosarum]|uniref:recombinase family protein n=1 Tax=Rhizobium leguminosarum TaxID=384 RepID=UPI001C959AFF|nr:recombinase family protein [Rhizobium leguminosarum]MBY5827381.1 recombinase family protein [Rhizobium leguminosarum]
MNDLKGLAHSDSLSGKESINGRNSRVILPHKSRTALYLRVSTPDQKPDLQYDGLRDYAERAGLVVVGEYLDVAVSGRREGRPQLGALMASARNREIDNVLVWKFDRFARSTRHLLTALEEFNHLGIRFISVQDQIDMASPMGKAMFTIIGAMAELESSLISERVTAGMQAAKSRGKHLGRPPLAQYIIAEIEHLAASTGLSVRKIHEKIAGKASRSVVGEIVERIRSEPGELVKTPSQAPDSRRKSAYENKP